MNKYGYLGSGLGHPVYFRWASHVALILWPLWITGLLATCQLVSAQTAAPHGVGNPAAALSAQQWQEVDRAVDRAIEYLVRQQQGNGRFQGYDTGQPAITSLAVMALLSRGERPGEGRYGDVLDRAIEFVLKTQSRTGMFSRFPAEPFLDQLDTDWDYPRAQALYNHAIAGLMVTEVFGMTAATNQERYRDAIERALGTSRTYQTEHKKHPRDVGGWRYMFRNNNVDADLSVTVWHLLFLRSAKNAGFEVPEQAIEDGMDYVRRCFDPSRQRFRYALAENDGRFTRAMCGAGILSLSLGGEHHSDMAVSAANSLLRDSFDDYNGSGGYMRDHYHYSVYYSTLGMFQIGGEAWNQFYPPLVKTLLEHQAADGSWSPEAAGGAAMFGRVPTTSMIVMALTVADQLVPIYQR